MKWKNILNWFYSQKFYFINDINNYVWILKVRPDNIIWNNTHIIVDFTVQFDFIWRNYSSWIIKKEDSLILLYLGNANYIVSKSQCKKGCTKCILIFIMQFDILWVEFYFIHNWILLRTKDKAPFILVSKCIWHFNYQFQNVHLQCFVRLLVYKTSFDFLAHWCWYLKVCDISYIIAYSFCLLDYAWLYKIRDCIATAWFDFRVTCQSRLCLTITEMASILKIIPFVRE